jgi:hypothetical protein
MHIIPGISKHEEGSTIFINLIVWFPGTFLIILPVGFSMIAFQLDDSLQKLISLIFSLLWTSLIFSVSWLFETYLGFRLIIKDTTTMTLPQILLTLPLVGLGWWGLGWFISSFSHKKS